MARSVDGDAESKVRGIVQDATRTAREKERWEERCREREKGGGGRERARGRERDRTNVRLEYNREWKGEQN